MKLTSPAHKSAIVSLSTVAVAVVFAAAAVGVQPSLARLLLLPLAVLVSISLTDAKNRLTFAFAVTVFYPLVRRVTAGPAAYIADDPLNLLPVAALLPLAVDGFRESLSSSARSARPLVRWLIVLLLSGLGGFALAPSPSLLFGLALQISLLMMALAASARADFVFPAGPVIGISSAAAAYGLYQYASPTGFDLAWLTTQQEALISVGRPSQGGFRLWGPMESPGPFAIVLGIALALCVLRSRIGPSQVLAIALLVPALLLTQVRTVLWGLPVALVLAPLLVPGAKGRLRRVVLAAGIVLIVLPLAGTVLASLSAVPAQSSRLQAAGILEDTSFLVRVETVVRGPLTEASILLPKGPGTASKGQAASDNGYIDVAIETSVFGLALFFGLLVSALRRLRRLKDRTGLTLVLLFTVAQLSGPVALAPSAMIFWYWLGVAFRVAPVETRVPEARSA